MTQFWRKKDVDTTMKTKQKMGFGRIHVEMRNLFRSKGNKADKVKTLPTHKMHSFSDDRAVETKSGKQNNIDELSPLENRSENRTLPSDTAVQTKSGKQNNIDELSRLENRNENCTLPSDTTVRTKSDKQKIIDELLAEENRYKNRTLLSDTVVQTKSDKQNNIDELSPLESRNKNRTLVSDTTVRTKSDKQTSIDELSALENRNKNRTIPSPASPGYGKLPSASLKRAAAVARQTSANSAKEHTEDNKAVFGRTHVLAKVDEDSNTYVDMTLTSVSTPTGVSQGDTVSPDPCYETSVFTRTNITKQSPLREIGSDAVNRVSVLGQTSADFYNYSVNEVVHCFALCALPDLAEFCKSEKLDGMFFRCITDEGLLKAPFSLSRLQLKKMYMAIREGWRPH